MDAKTRIIVNTSAQYIKTIVSGVITLYSSRVILSSLGVEDFGIYSLIAGIVMMLSFLTNALSSTTQRFISYYQGAGELTKVKEALTNSLCVHICMGLLFALVFFALTPLLFNGFLNIELNRIGAAKSIYFAVIVTLFVSFLNAPYRAVLISHENIVYISVIDTLDVTLKLIIALSLSWVSFDKLIYYGWALLLIQIFDLAASAVFCYVKYDECTRPKISEISKPYLKGLLSFAGWNVYSLACTFGRTQGIAVLVNKFLGAVVNAAYGIGLQLSSYVGYVSESLLNAIRPQIVKAEGESDRDKMFFLSEKASKFSFLLSSFLTIPCLFEMPKLLDLWLGDYPKEAIVFCQCFLMAGIVDSVTIGLHTANQAIGNLKLFALVINTSKFLTLPIAFICLYLGKGVVGVAVTYVIVEFLCALMRIPILKRDGLRVKSYFKNVFLKILPPFFLCFLFDYIIVALIDNPYRIIITFGCTFLIYPILVLFLGLDSYEYSVLKNATKKIFLKIHRIK